MFKDERLMNPGDSFNLTLEFLTKQKEKFESSIPLWADIGFLKIDTTQLRNRLIPSPNELIKRFQTFMPSMIRERNEEIRKTMKDYNDLLKGKAPNIDEFVKRQNALKTIIRRLPRIKDRFGEINHIFNIADVKFEMKKEDKQNIVETTSSIKKLELAISEAE